MKPSPSYTKAQTSLPAQFHEGGPQNADNGKANEQLEKPRAQERIRGREVAVLPC